MSTERLLGALMVVGAMLASSGCTGKLGSTVEKNPKAQAATDNKEEVTPAVEEQAQCPLPASTPSPIKVNVGSDGSTRVYSVADEGALQWTFPAGWTVASGQGSNSVTVTVSGPQAEDIVSVAFTNQCGAGPARSVGERANLSLTSVSLNESCQLRVDASYEQASGATFTGSTVETTFGQVASTAADHVLIDIPSFEARSFAVTWNLATTDSSHSLNVPVDIVRAVPSQLAIPSTVTALNAPTDGLEASTYAGGCGASCLSNRRASISADKHVCVVNSDSTVSCWGLNALGRLGDGTTTNRSTPVLVLEGASPLTGAIVVGVEHDHSCALTDQGNVKCWGYNDKGQLGNDTFVGSLTAVSVVNSSSTGNLSGVAKLRTGLRSACAILSDGSLQCWGWAIRATYYNTQSARPKQIANLGAGTVVDVGIGYGHTCAVKSTGSIYCWGAIDNPSAGELGDGTTIPAYSDAGERGPVQVVGITDAVQVVSGEYYSCALHAGGTVSCWGAWNQLGDGSSSNRSTPGPVPGLTDVVGLSRVTFGTCATRGDGQVSCWGKPGITAFTATPTALVLPEPVVATALVAANTNKPFGTCHLTMSGSIICNGPNEYGQLANGTTATAGVLQANYTEVDLGSKTVQRLDCTVGKVQKTE